LWDEDRLDGLARADVEQPLPRAVRRMLVAQHIRRADLGKLLEPRPKLHAQVGHCVELADAALIDPTHDLTGAKWLLAERDEELGETVRRQTEQVHPAAVAGSLDRQRVRGQRSASAKKNPISAAAVSGPSDPCTTFSSMEAAKSARIVPAAAFAGFVAPMRSRFF